MRNRSSVGALLFSRSVYLNIAAASAFALAGLSAPAGANEGPAETAAATTPVTPPSQEALSAMTRAIEAAEQKADARFAFTMTRTDVDEGEERRYRLRYDPRLDEEQRWTLLEPDFEALNKREKKALKQLRKSGMTDAGMIYDGLEFDAETARLVSEDETRAAFIVPLPDDDDDEMPEKIRKAMQMQVTVNKADGYVEEILVTALEPFKPAPVAKVTSFRNVQTYAPATPGGPVYLQQSSSEVSGKAMMAKFNSISRMEFAEVEQVDAPPREEDGEE